MTYGQDLKRRLKKHGLTQASLAKTMGVDRGCISHYITGRNEPRQARRLWIENYFSLLDAAKSSRTHQAQAQAQTQTHQEKRDAGKARLSLVPVQGIYAVAEVREYGVSRYGATDSWRAVEPQRYMDALHRHLLAMVGDMCSRDDESGIEHYKHVACNALFLCELLKGGYNDIATKSSKNKA